jgi:hypothetical protein
VQRQEYGNFNIKYMKINLKNKSWRTTIIGIVLIILGTHGLFVLWRHEQTIWNNITRIELGPLAAIFAGWLGIHSRDHKCKDE